HNRTAGTNGTVVIFIFMEIEGQKISQQKANNINDYKISYAHAVNNNICEKIKRKHIEQQMRKICVQKCRTEHSNMFSSTDTRYVEFILFKERKIAETFH